MSSKEYIKSRLQALVIIFPDLRVRYEEDLINNSHVVEIFPNEVFHKSSKYQQTEEDIIFDFIENYPFENMIFIAADDEDYKIQNITYEIFGYNFETVEPTVCFENFCDFGSSEIFHHVNNELLTCYTPKLAAQVKSLMDQNFQILDTAHVFYTHNNYSSFWIESNYLLINNLKMKIVNPTFKASKEKNYALAS